MSHEPRIFTPKTSGTTTAWDSNGEHAFYSDFLQAMDFLSKSETWGKKNQMEHQTLI